MNLRTTSFLSLAAFAGISLVTPVFAVVNIGCVTVGAAGAANYYDGVDYAVTQSGSYSSSQNYLTDVGAYGPNSDSAYGTNDQAGNVFVWNDAVIGSSRGLRDGSWDNTSFNLPASGRSYGTPTGQDDGIRFRVASVPETSAGLLTMLSVSACLMRRRRSTLCLLLFYPFSLDCGGGFQPPSRISKQGMRPEREEI